MAFRSWAEIKSRKGVTPMSESEEEYGPGCDANGFALSKEEGLSRLRDLRPRTPMVEVEAYKRGRRDGIAEVCKYLAVDIPDHLCDELETDPHE